MAPVARPAITSCRKSVMARREWRLPLEGGGRCVRDLDRPSPTSARTRRPIQVAGRIGWGCLSLAPTLTSGHGQRARAYLAQDHERRRAQAVAALRAKQVEGLRFRRQHPIGKYIVDFV